MISIIVAIDQNNGIGIDNRLLCHLPNDMKYFKQVTSGHPVIMGRHTYESLPIKPLPNRKNIVISTSLFALDGCTMVSSVEDALKQCPAEEECFVIGGSQIYQQMMSYAQKLYVTHIYHQFEADVFFPKIDTNAWNLISSESHPSDDRHLYAYSFEIYQKEG